MTAVGANNSPIKMPIWVAKSLIKNVDPDFVCDSDDTKRYFDENQRGWLLTDIFLELGDSLEDKSAILLMDAVINDPDYEDIDSFLLVVNFRVHGKVRKYNEQLDEMEWIEIQLIVDVLECTSFDGMMSTDTYSIHLCKSEIDDEHNIARFEAAGQEAADIIDFISRKARRELDDDSNK